jgi:hypothetical protein
MFEISYSMSVDQLKEVLLSFLKQKGRLSEYDLEVVGSKSNYEVLRIKAKYMLYSTDMPFFTDVIVKAGYGYYITACSDIVVLHVVL